MNVGLEFGKPWKMAACAIRAVAAGTGKMGNQLTRHRGSQQRTPLPAAPSREDQRESNSNPAPVHGQSKTGLTGSHPGAPTQDADELLRNGAAGLRGYATLLHFNGNLNDAKKYNAQADAIDAYLSRKEQ